MSVLVAHPYPIIREGLGHMIREAGFDVSSPVGDREALFKAASERDPDIILVDFRLLKRDPGLIDTLKNKTRGIVTVIAVPEEIGEAPEALRAGAKGYLSYGQTLEEFVKSLSLLARGSVVISRVASGQVQDSINKGREAASGLSGREREIAVLVARGATNREIAGKLAVSQHTVKNHLHHILTKLDLRNRQQLAAFAIRQGWVEDVRTENIP